MHHVFARGVLRRPLFESATDLDLYVDMLAGVAQRFEWRCLSYCLMHNHVHLLVETEQPTLGKGVQRLHGDYAAAFNDRHDRTGHLFERRYGSRRIRDDAYMWAAAPYVARNPVEAGMCRAAEDWPWSSYAATIDGTAPDWIDAGRLLEYFSAFGGDPLARYVEAVGAPAPEEKDGAGAETVVVAFA